MEGGASSSGDSSEHSTQGVRTRVCICVCEGVCVRARVRVRRCRACCGGVVDVVGSMSPRTASVVPGEPCRGDYTAAGRVHTSRWCLELGHQRPLDSTLRPWEWWKGVKKGQHGEDALFGLHPSVGD